MCGSFPVVPPVLHSPCYTYNVNQYHIGKLVFDIGRDAALVKPLQIEGGCVVLNEEPGSGIVFEMDFLDDHRADLTPGQSLARSYLRAPDAGLTSTAAAIG